MSFRILVGIYCHNIPTCTPQSGYHGVTEVAKTTNIAKMAENCISSTSARPTPPHTNPIEPGPANTFSARNRKKPKDSLSSTQKKGGSFFQHTYLPVLSPNDHPNPSQVRRTGFGNGQTLTKSQVTLNNLNNSNFGAFGGAMARATWA